MPYQTLPSGTQTHDFWSEKITRMSDDFLFAAWTVWSILAGLAGMANACVILIILSSKELRKKQFNKLCLALAFPDFVFGTSCSVSCAIHRSFGRFYGGDLHCDIQGFYVIFGFGASIWMNVVIASELYRMVNCARLMKRYVPLSSLSICRRVGIVYLVAILLAVLELTPGVPIRYNAGYGLACVPLSYDRDSTLFFWLFFIPALLLVPLLFVLWYFCSTFFILRKLNKSNDLQESKALFSVFFKLLAALVIFWLPTAVFMWIVSSGTLGFVGGLVSHLQGMVSAFIYCTKTDISTEVKARLGGLACLKKIASRPPNETVCSSAEALGHKSCNAFLSEEDRLDDLQKDERLQCSECVVGDAESYVFLDVLTEPDCETPIDTQASVASPLSLRATELTRRIIGSEQVPMMVVPFHRFVAHGRVPSSTDGLQRQLEISDTVIFVSHRWWGSSQPDDEGGHKFGLICRGVAAIAQQFRSLYPASNSLVIWIDYACIDQVDEGMRQQGIASLFSYVARSNIMFIPVFPDLEAVRTLNRANHPFELINYGERAWCRLEVYVYLCVGELLQQPLHCFAYGLKAFGPAKRSLLKQLLNYVHQRVLSLLGSMGSRFTPYEGLKKMGVSKGGANFKYDYLPSKGLLTDETDRETIARIELEVRLEYTKAVVARALQHMGRTQGLFSLASKQFSKWDVPFLLSELRTTPLKALRELNLEGNLLTGVGAAQLITVLVGRPGSRVESFDFSENCLKASCADKLRDALLSLSRPLRRLVLRGNVLGAGAVEVIAGAHKVIDLLDLSENQIGDSGAVLISNLLRNEPVGTRCATQTLGLGKNGITTHTAEKLLAACTIVVDLTGNPISQDAFAVATMRQASAMI